MRGDVLAIASTLIAPRPWLRDCARVLAVGRAVDRLWVRTALLAGAVCIVDEREEVELLARRVAEVSRGVSVLPTWACEQLVSGLARDVVLTPLERAILISAGGGRTVSGIAADFHYSERHMWRLLAELRGRFGVGTLAELLSEARRRGALTS
jgi:DNA-binding NarL/FixJ family response regulator